MNRDELKELDFHDKELKLHYAGDVRSYTCVKCAGPGQTATAWKVVDRLAKTYVMKLVLKQDYQNHSIDAEMKRVMALRSRFAQIVFFGEPEIVGDSITSLKDTYGIIIDWVEGITLKEFLEKDDAILDVPQFLMLARHFCEALALLQETGLSHNDLHDRNIMVTRERKGPNLDEELDIRIIDTGALKTNDRLEFLLERWTNDALALAAIPNPSSEIQQKIQQLKDWTSWFSRTDQEWIVMHLCRLASLARRHEYEMNAPQRRFLNGLLPLLRKMLDADRAMRLESPKDMYHELELLWKHASTPQSLILITPFDLISAELIRSDQQLNILFSSKCPWFEHCATTDPIYIYGPRGCGKSTILRKLALPAVLADPDSKELFKKRPYIGVYLSCTSELRSRFWLFAEAAYDEIQSDVVLFFSLLLVDALLETLDLLRNGAIESRLGQSVGLSNETARTIFDIVCTQFGLPKIQPQLAGVSWIAYGRRRLAIERNTVWHRLLTSPRKTTPTPSLIFDICKQLEEVFPLLKEKHISFLLDDYSNQRIPVRLQRILNQTISFAKQGNPIFKVSSEYHGVDLEGIQEGREVVEVNLGREYVQLADAERSVFLEDVFDIRFKQAQVNTNILDLLGKSDLQPGLPMARSIRDSVQPNGRPFYYHGIDTVADICSGDLAMALDLVKQIYVSVKSQHTLPKPVPASAQHDIIKQYSDREHMYIRYYSPHGKAMSTIADSLCDLAAKAVRVNLSKKDGEYEPMIKTHLDIATEALKDIAENLQELLLEMQRKGILFSLDTSRSRIDNKGTERFQVRRILLVKYISPLGRRDPIKIDHSQKLVYLLNEPVAFCKEELTGQKEFYFRANG